MRCAALRSARDRLCIDVVDPAVRDPASVVRVAVIVGPSPRDRLLGQDDDHASTVDCRPAVPRQERVDTRSTGNAYHHARFRPSACAPRRDPDPPDPAGGARHVVTRPSGLLDGAGYCSSRSAAPARRSPSTAKAEPSRRASPQCSDCCVRCVFYIRRRRSGRQPLVCGTHERLSPAPPKRITQTMSLGGGFDAAGGAVRHDDKKPLAVCRTVPSTRSATALMLHVAGSSGGANTTSTCRSSVTSTKRWSAPTSPGQPSLDRCPGRSPSTSSIARPPVRQPPSASGGQDRLHLRMAANARGQRRCDLESVLARQGEQLSS